MSGRRNSLRTVLAASMVGSTLEWYDYMIFGNAAALAFPTLFFPGTSYTAGVLSSFATFAVGFVARPIGAVIAGHFGDRVGRRRVLIVTLLVMGVATFAIGLLPTYRQVGFWAPALLVFLRVVQGLALGGEWGGSVLLAVEQVAGGRRKGLLGSFPQMGDPMGLLLSSGVFAVMTGVDPGAFLAWGWRVPFLLSAVVVGVGLWLRLLLDETPEFVRRMELAAPERAPLVSVLRTMPGNFVLSMGTRLGVDIGFYIFTVFSITYVESRHLFSSDRILTATIVGAAVGLVTTPLFGALADRIGARLLSVCGLAALGVSGFVFFPLLDTRQLGLVTLALVMAYGVAAIAAWAPYAGLLSNVFPVRMRYTGTSFSFQFAGILGGGIAPYVATSLFHHYGSAIPVSLYEAVAVVISIACLLTVRLQSDRRPVTFSSPTANLRRRELKTR